MTHFKIKVPLKFSPISACEIERFTECFTIAYGTGRTLIYDSTYFMYTKNNYADIYLPLSNTCADNFNDTEQIWPGKLTGKMFFE